METDILNEYVNMCRLLGGWTDWVQGPGGNCSIKFDGKLLVKRSGALIGNTTDTNGWVLCDMSGIQTALREGREDISRTVLEGEGKPSIEAFFHCLSSRIVVHLHPAPLLPLLCSSTPISLPGSKTIEYLKPGIPLANALLEAYDSDTRIYFMKQHGVLFMGETLDEIMEHMIKVSTLFDGPRTNISTVRSISDKIFRTLGFRYLFKPWFGMNVHVSQTFLPYTPDIAVFLTSSPSESNIDTVPTVVMIDGICYTIGNTLEQCMSVFEILYAHGCGKGTFLSEDQVLELITWDKEKERKQIRP
jgi:ribulose-5-phosphate 4-epimerase/fuculose-1-phosphate aldolase